jgi:hypothetical protein
MSLLGILNRRLGYGDLARIVGRYQNGKHFIIAFQPRNIWAKTQLVDTVRNLPDTGNDQDRKFWPANPDEEIYRTISENLDAGREICVCGMLGLDYATLPKKRAPNFLVCIVRQKEDDLTQISQCPWNRLRANAAWPGVYLGECCGSPKQADKRSC